MEFRPSDDHSFTPEEQVLPTAELDPAVERLLWFARMNGKLKEQVRNYHWSESRLEQQLEEQKEFYADLKRRTDRLDEALTDEREAHDKTRFQLEKANKVIKEAKK